MRVVKINVLVLLFLQMLVQAAHFTPPTSNYQPMNIYIIEAKFNGVDLVTGDEIAVFDGSVCAAATVLGHVASSSNPVSMIAYKKNNGDTGFTEGNSMTFKGWDASAGIEYTFQSGEVAFFDPVTGSPVPPAEFEGHGTVMVALDGSPSIPTFTLTMQTTTGGTTSPAPGAHAYTTGTVVSIQAVPNDGWQFDYWSGPVANPNSASTTVTLDGNKTVTAYFKCIKHTLSMSLSPAGSGSIKPAGPDTLVCEGAVITVRATPAAGYQFTGWSGPVANPSSATTTVTVDADVSLTANFSAIVIPNYTLIMQVNQSGWGTTTPAVGSYVHAANTVVNITATPAAGYRFVSWSGGVTNPTNQSTTVTMNSNKTVTANFERIQYVLTMQVNQAGWGTTTPAVGDHSYNSGDVVGVLATPASGYRFVNWTGEVANSNNASTTVTMNAAKTVRANCERIQYTLTVEPASNGSSTPAPGTYSYGSGEIVPISATPNSGYKFSTWTGSVTDPNAASTTVVISANKTIRPNFALLNTYTLTLSKSPSAGGTTTPASGTYNYTEGSTVTLTATPAAGYHFVNWTGNVAGVSDVTSPSINVLMNSSRSITANFALDAPPPRTLTMQVNQAGWGTTTPAAGNHVYAQGTNVTIRALPATNYRFVSWTGAVANASAVETTVFIDGDKTVTANFEPIPQHTLTMQVNPAGTGTTTPAAGSYTYYENTVVNLSVSPAAGYRFANWLGGVANPNSATTTITITSNKTVTANFEPIPQYTITVTAPNDPSMGTTNPGAGTYTLYENATMTLRAIPNPGYEFANWNNDPTLTSSTITVTATSNKTYTPIFQPLDDVVLTVQVNDPAMGDVIPSVGPHTYNEGDVIDLEGHPKAGYRFNYWTGDVANSNAATTTVTMDGNKTVKANFDNIIYRLNMSVSPANGGTVIPPAGTSTYKSWKTVAITANPAVGYKFTGWTGDVADNLDPTTTVLMSGDKDVRANFAPFGQYTLTMNVSPAGGGSTSPAAGTHVYNYNETVTVTASPAAGYVFKEWLGGVVNATSPQTTVTISADKNITAVFEPDIPDFYQLTLRVSPSNTGTTAPAIGTHDYAPGSVVTLTATPKTGYHFVSWSGEVADAYSITTTTTVNGNKTITANFEAGTNEYRFTIDVSPALSGATTPPVGAHYYTQGEVVNISATPAAGYVFDYWTGDVSQPSNPFTTVTIDADKGVIAHFRQATRYTLTMAKSPADGGSVIPAVGSYQYDSGAVALIQAIPAAGYDFVRWEGQVADPNSATTTVTMNSNKTVTAIFAQTVQQVILTMQVDPVGGGITGPAPGSHSFNMYATVNITAVPNSGYEFSHWTGGVSDPYAASTTVTMDQNKTVTAYFVPGAPEKVTLSIVANPSEGGATLPAAGTYEYDLNSTVTITATPAAGYYFAGWNGDVSEPANATTTVHMHTDQTVVANFARTGSDNVIISYNISPVETGTTAPAPGIHIYSRGQVITISAIPFDGYYFAGWYGDVKNPDSSTTTVLADTNKEITATFKLGAPSRYNLTMMVNPTGGGLTAPEIGTHTYNENEIVNITTVPMPGYVFKEWAGDVDEKASQTTKIKMTGHKTVVASFDYLAPNQYTLTIGVSPVGGGVTTPAVGSHAYNAGLVVNLLAVPSTGYRFDGWTGDVDNPNSAATSVRMTQNKTITARFVPDKFTVTMAVAPEGAGATKPSLGDTLVSDGNNITIRALPKTGWQFTAWSGDASGDTNPLTLKVSANLRITAHFSELNEAISKPTVNTATNVFRKQGLDVFVANATSNLGHNLEYQFDWGDGQQSAWIDLKSQNRAGITTITTPVGGSGLPSSGQLIDFNTGAISPVTLAVRGGSFRGNVDAWSGEEPLSGTDAAKLFAPILSCRGAISYVNSPSDVLTLDLTGLNPAREYTIVFYANRNRYTWSQASLVTLSGADYFINTSSAGLDELGEPIIAGPQAPNTKLPADNTSTGYIARFEKIRSGNDGAATLSVSFGGKEGQEFKGKYGSAVMVQEIDPATRMVTMLAFNDLAWDDHFYSHAYSAAGAYLVRARARCKNHPTVVSDWAEVHSLLVAGCAVSSTVTDGANAVVKRTPEKPDYDYGELVTLTAQGGNNWVFSHWNENRADSAAVKQVFVNDNKYYHANFIYVTGVQRISELLPKDFGLLQNYPNPFNPSTEIVYEIPQPEHVTLRVHDVRGRLVKVLVDMQQPAGRYRVTWDATNAASQKISTGLYFYTLEAGDYRMTRRMVLLK